MSAEANWSKWVDLGVGLLGLLYLVPPYRTKDIGGVIISIGFLLRFVIVNGRF